MDLISIITPAYNAERTIKRTIDSVINQIYQNWELIIIEDNSIDKTENIILQYSKDKRIRLIKNVKNIGPARSRNIGLKIIKGQYVTFIDADDTWEIDFLSHIYNFSKKNSYQFCFASYKIFNIQKNRYITSYIVPEKISYHDLLKENYISCLTAFYRLEKNEKIFFENIANEDYKLWLGIIKKTKYAYGVQKEMGTYYLSHNSVSSNKIKILVGRWNIYRKKEQLTFIYSVFLIVIYVYRSIKKYYTLKLYIC